MKFALKVAWRYIFSKKTTNVINVISAVSMTGIVIGSAALIIVLSAFNGFEELVKKLYGSFYPDVHISASEGKVFNPDTLDLEAIRRIEGVEALSLSLEENALIIYEDEEHIARLKGVDDAFARVNAVDDSVVVGEYGLSYEVGSAIQRDCAVLGAGVATVLSVSLGHERAPMEIFMPKRGLRTSLNPRNSFNQKKIYPVGVFRIQQDFDSRYVIVPLAFIQSLLEYEKEISSVEIKVARGVSVSSVIQQIERIAGPSFTVKDRYQLNEFVYKVMKTEKWAVYFVLTFILMVAAFNMIGSISMLVIEKKKDIGILQSMGAHSSLIRRIFLLEGTLQTFLSVAIGFSVALILCLLQMQFGLLKIPGQGTFVVSAYPVAIKWADFVMVFFTIMLIGSLASYLPASRAAASRYVFKEE